MSTIDTSTWSPDSSLNTDIGGIPLNASASIQQTWQAIQMLMAALKGDTAAIELTINQPDGTTIVATDQTLTVVDNGHAHTIANVAGLQTVLDGKAANAGMTGATASADGASGLVPQPEAGDQDKVLKGDGTWGSLSASDIPSLDASKITSGTVDLARLPAGALERLVPVADQTARYALTAADVQLGDTVQEQDTGLLYLIVDTDELDNASGYVEYVAGSASSVPWSGVTDKPASFTPSPHTHGNLTNGGAIGSASGLPIVTGPDGVLQTGSFGAAAGTFCEGNDARLVEAAPMAWVKDELRTNVEAISGGRNTVVRDQWDNPHVMVVVPKFRLSDIDSAWPSSTHPAFVVNGTERSEILIGKYFASQNAGGRVQTLPRMAPWVQIVLDDAVSACRSLGTGFCLNTNAMWAARALWDYKRLGGSHEYLGNRNYGRDSTYHEIAGVMKSGAYIPGSTSLSDAATLAGTGGQDWNDDGTAYGIADLAGNVWEMVGGLRLVDGEVQILPNNDAALATADLSSASSEWKAIFGDGTLAVPGTQGTLKYDGNAADTRTSWGDSGTFRLNNALVNQNVKGFYSILFKNLASVSGLAVPNVLKWLALFPAASDVQGKMWMCNKGERMALRGGSWSDGSAAGPFALGVHNARLDTRYYIGFRIAYVA